jgi:hypothetical protein
MYRSCNFLILFLLVSTSIYSQEEKNAPAEKAVELNEVVVTKQKKAVEQKADRTIFDFSEQAYLNSGSVLEGLRKLPGLIISDVAGMLYQGKQLEVFMDGRPLNIYSNELNAFLEGMPANSIEKVEIITQPGAEFPATSGGAIINIITSKSAKNYLSATYSAGVNFTSYDSFRARINNSLLLNARNKYFGWQLNIGQNYRESALTNNLQTNENNVTTLLSNSFSDRVSRGEFIRSALTFDLKKDRLLLNYDVNFNNNDAQIIGSGLGFENNDFSKTKSIRQDALLTYQKRFENYERKLDFRFNFTKNDNDFNQDSRLFNTVTLDNSSNQQYLNFRVDYSQPINILEKGKISFGGLVDELTFETKQFNALNLDYSRQTVATYLEFQSSYKNFDFIAGTRAEDYNITGKTDTDDLIPFKQFRFFPNASVQYNIDSQIFINANYNKKISLPSTSSLNPNNTNFQNPNVTFGGNPQLQPTIFNNYEVKISAFDYAFLSYNISQASNQVVTRILVDNNTVNSTNINVDAIKVESLNFGFPLPYMLFTKGLEETLKFDFNPDKINFLYIYLGYQKHHLPDISTRGLLFYNFMSQILLPKDIKFITNFNGSTTGGNYYYFVGQEPFSQSLDITLSKKFLDDNLSVALNFDDILNTNVQGLGSVGTPLELRNKYDTRRFGFTINYKIPTKNKLAKVAPNLLNDGKKEEKDVIGN